MCPQMRFVKYDAGEEFRPHQDDVDYAVDGHRHRLCRSGLTLVLYLNDNFEGGGLQFLQPPRVVVEQGSKPQTVYDPTAAPLPPARGRALLFPQHLYHTATSLAAGSKYVVQTSIMYARQQQT